MAGRNASDARRRGAGRLSSVSARLAGWAPDAELVRHHPGDLAHWSVAALLSLRALSARLPTAVPIGWIEGIASAPLERSQRPARL